jgi:hypothetical protein
MVRAASGAPFLRANPAASIRLEGLLVRGALCDTVRKNRGAMKRQNHLEQKARPAEPFGIQTPYPVKSFGIQRRTLPEVEGLLE